MKPAVVFLIASILLYMIFTGKAEALWNAVTGVASGTGVPAPASTV